MRKGKNYFNKMWEKKKGCDGQMIRWFDGSMVDGTRMDAGERERENKSIPQRERREDEM